MIVRHKGVSEVEEGMCHGEEDQRGRTGLEREQQTRRDETRDRRKETEGTKHKRTVQGVIKIKLREKSTRYDRKYKEETRGER